MEPGCISNGISEYDTIYDSEYNTDRNIYIHANAYSEWYDNEGK